MTDSKNSAGESSALRMEKGSGCYRAMDLIDHPLAPSSISVKRFYLWEKAKKLHKEMRGYEDELDGLNRAAKGNTREKEILEVDIGKTQRSLAEITAELDNIFLKKAKAEQVDQYGRIERRGDDDTPLVRACADRAQELMDAERVVFERFLEGVDVSLRAATVLRPRDHNSFWRRTLEVPVMTHSHIRRRQRQFADPMIVKWEKTILKRYRHLLEAGAVPAPSGRYLQESDSCSNLVIAENRRITTALEDRQEYLRHNAKLILCMRGELVEGEYSDEKLMRTEDEYDALLKAMEQECQVTTGKIAGKILETVLPPGLMNLMKWTFTRKKSRKRVHYTGNEVDPPFE
jgi:hypothetical protein